MIIRPIQNTDNRGVEVIIRACLIEFGGNREGLAWADPELGRLSDYYAHGENRAYWVAEADGRLLGGCGIAPFDESSGICELQKMYLVTEARGTGAAEKLLSTALEFAARHYEACYLETLVTMQAANRFYEKNGFTKLAEPLPGSDHFACDAWYIKPL